MTLLTAEGLYRRYDDQVILDGVSFSLTSHHRIGLVGRNGCGKTTLLDIIADHARPDSGRIERSRKCLIDYSLQELNDNLEDELFTYVASARDDLLQLRADLQEVQEQLQTTPDDAALVERLGQLQSDFELSGGFSFEHEVSTILEGLGFAPDRHRDQLKRFSGGERNRASLARVLAGRGSLLLLDEPTNHLDIESTRWLEEYLRGSDRAYIVVSHDRAFLEATADHIWEMQYGHIDTYTGGLRNYLVERAERRRLHEHRYRHQQEEIKRLEEFVRRNMAGQKTKQAQSKLKYINRIKRLPPPRTDARAARIKMESSGRSYAHVLAVENLALGYTADPIVNDVAFDLYRGDRVGLIGRNGTGKSTLLKALVGELAPMSGDIRLGNNVDVAYFDQELGNLNLEQQVIDTIWELDPTAESGTIRSFLARFGFSGDDVLKKVASLSGGEKTKLSLGRLLYYPANFIIFDEPTNHLDMDSREVLEEALLGYEGSCLIVSHDRFFLDRVANRILHLDDCRIAAYDGNYSDFKERQEALAAANQPVKEPKSKEDYLAFKERSKQRGRHKKALQRTREEIAQHESELKELERKLSGDIAPEDWEALQKATEKKHQIEEHLLALYSRLEELENVDLD